MTTGKPRTKTIDGISRSSMYDLERREEARRKEDKELRDMSQRALSAATDAVAAIGTHERVCAERYGAIRSDVSDIKSLIKWAGCGVVVMLVTVLWWVITTQAVHH